MDHLEYDRLFKAIPDDYTSPQIRLFIKALWVERDRIIKQLEDYKTGIMPTYVKNHGGWYNGLCLRIHAIDKVKSIAVQLCRERKNASS